MVFICTSYVTTFFYFSVSVSVSVSGVPLGSRDGICACGLCSRVLEWAPSAFREHISSQFWTQGCQIGGWKSATAGGLMPQKPPRAPNPASLTFFWQGAGGAGCLTYTSTPRGTGGWVVTCVTSCGRFSPHALLCCHYRYHGLSTAQHDVRCTHSLSFAGVK